jgi:hypothetical protein
MDLHKPLSGCIVSAADLLVAWRMPSVIAPGDAQHRKLHQYSHSRSCCVQGTVDITMLGKSHGITMCALQLQICQPDRKMLAEHSTVICTVQTSVIPTTISPISLLLHPTIPCWLCWLRCSPELGMTAAEIASDYLTQYVSLQYPVVQATGGAQLAPTLSRNAAYHPEAAVTGCYATAVLCRCGGHHRD